MKIRKTFIKFSIILAVVPVIIMTVLGGFAVNKYTYDLLEQIMVVAASNQSINIDNFLNERISKLKIISELNSVKCLLADDKNNNMMSAANDEKIRSTNELLDLTKEQEAFSDNLSIINSDGIVISSSKGKYIGKRDLLNEKNIIKLKNNNNLLSNVIEDDTINNGEKSIIISTPIFVNDEFYGAVLDIIDLEYFNDMIYNVNLFTHGYLSIIDENFNLIADENDDVIEYIKEGNLYDQLEKVNLKKSKNGLIVYKNINKSERIGYYCEIDSNGWIVLMSYDRAEIIRPFSNMLKIIGVIVCFILIAIVAANLFAIKHFSKPVNDFITLIKKMETENNLVNFKYNKENELGMITKAFNKLVDKINDDKELIESNNSKLESLIYNIPGGVYGIKVINNDINLFYISEIFSNIVGYEVNEIDDKDFILNIVHPKDRDLVIQTMKDIMLNGGNYNRVYRIYTKSGEIIWVKDKGQAVIKNDHEIIIYGVLIDISEEKKALESLKISEEKYQILFENVNDLFFQWDAEGDKLDVCNEWNEFFKYKPIEKNLKNDLIGSDNLHKDDVDTVINMIQKLFDGSKKAEEEIRFLTKGDKYVWVRVIVTAIFDEEKNLKRVIGVLVDIDEEKKERDRLVFEAQRDGLTNLYNKKNTELMIENYLKNYSNEELASLIIIDIDDFKSINDKLGHINGDKALKIVADNLLQLFHHKDSIIGRIGGDEFIVFIKNTSRDKVIKSAEKLIDTFNNIYIDDNNNNNYKVSGSIGIAICPENGTQFNKLYENADKALYKAKLSGKDRYCIYDD